MTTSELDKFIYDNFHMFDIAGEGNDAWWEYLRGLAKKHKVTVYRGVTNDAIFMLCNAGADPGEIASVFTLLFIN
jgi:hypothetical protein